MFNLGLSKASELKVGDAAPEVKLQTDQGTAFDLSQRKGQWTILYFYPKAETPGCTKQACAFRDSISKIHELKAEVFGVSNDSVDALVKFKKNHHLNFTLLADPKSEVIDKYGTKMPLVGMSKRWTFIVDPNVKIAYIDKDVDPVLDAQKMANKIKELTAGK